MSGKNQEADQPELSPIGFGVEWPKGSYLIVIPKGTPIPVRVSHKFVTHSWEKSLEINTFFGEDQDLEKNRFLASFLITGYPPSVETPVTEVFFTIDGNGIISLLAQTESGTQLTCRRTVLKGGLSAKELRDLQIRLGENTGIEIMRNRKGVIDQF